jgi:protein-L-isoaspartate(D-aspartate) O-methyltransferase
MTSSAADPYQPKRMAMVSRQLRERGIREERVLAAMAEVPRHEFVPPGKLQQAYEDQPLEIEAQQTISQPYVVAAMLQALALAPGDTVLEVGTGSGYQTALLARLAARVCTIERYPELSDSAQVRLTRLGFCNLEFFVGDGSLGLPQRAPFDAIIVSAAAPRVPHSLLQQLHENGRLVLPVGDMESQQLVLVRKQNGEVLETELEGCRFVPLIGAEGFNAGS